MLHLEQNLDIFLKFADLSEKEFLDSVEHLRDKDIWEKDHNGNWNLQDWIGNHIDDDGVNEARLPIKEKWSFTKTQRDYASRDYSNLDDDEELIFL